MDKRLLHNEKELLLRVAEGDEHAFSAIYDFYRAGVYATALKLTGRVWQAEEILQDTFLKVWIKREDLKGVENFGGWVYTIAEHLTFNSIQTAKRREHRMKEYAFDPDIGTNPDRGISEQEYEQILQAAVERLPEKQRQTYLLVKEQGMKRDEAAKELRVSPETIKSNLDYAMKNMRAYCLARMQHLPAFIAAIWPFKKYF